jgi:hypothetical protein
MAAALPDAHWLTSMRVTGGRAGMISFNIPHYTDNAPGLSQGKYSKEYDA